MKRFNMVSFALAALLASSLAMKVEAQTANSASGAASNSNSNSGANSFSASGATGGNAAAINGASTGASSVTFNSGNNSPYSVNNPNDVTIRSAPQIYVPSVITGNVCALGASAGASWLGAGFAVGTSWESAQCENRHRVALLYNMGEKAAAKEVLCDTKEVYEGFKRTGNPCVVRPQWEPKENVSQLPAKPVVPVAAPAPRMAFNASMYATGADCLNAASAAGASLSECAGKR